jgi:hypothetical protein
VTAISPVAAAVTEQALAFLDDLDESQQAQASFDLRDTDERTNWAYFPRQHKGVPLLGMSPKQQKSAHALVTASLSLPAYARACSIMALESVLNLLEERRLDAARDPGRYFFSIFGSPREDAWGWRLEGHHVCLNYTIMGGEIVSATPLFLGANPATVFHRDTPVLRPCAEEEDSARAFLEMLDAGQRDTAIVCETAPPDFVMMNAPVVPEDCLPSDLVGALQPRPNLMTDEEKHAVRFSRAEPLGLPASALTPTQLKVLADLIDVYIHRLPEPLASSETERIDVRDVYFAWAGVVERRKGHYYRLQSPNFLVEYDCTQDDANHVHTVWRDMQRDFGLDALRAHTAGSHA